MSNEPTAKLFVGNLAWATTNESLHDAFAPYGNVVEAVVITERDNPSRSRGYGFVTMSTPDEAAAAQKALNGSNLDGREGIRIDFAQPKNDDRGGRGDWTPRPAAPAVETPSTDMADEATDEGDQE